MKISVVTPSFNQGRFIGECFTSVRAQKGDFSVEHIVLDNCSSDRTGEELARYQAEHGEVDVRIVVEADKGQTDAINRGFRMATGDIVCWLNTDERYHDGALAEVVGFFAAHPEVDVLFGNCDFVDAEGRLVKRKREYFFSRSMLLYYGCFIPSCATFARRRVIDDGVLLDPYFRVVMDLDWYLRLAFGGYRFGRTSDSLASFCWHGGNISLNNRERSRQEQRLLRDRVSIVVGPVWFRRLVHYVAKHVWIAIRVASRLLGRLAEASGPGTQRI